MKTSTHARVGLFLFLGFILSGCQGIGPRDPQAEAAPAELTQRVYLQLVMRYLYRWQLDESEFETILSQKDVVFWIRPLHPKLDPGDRSQFAEILLPQVNLSARVKKASYTIPEIETAVKSQNFKIVLVTQGEVPRHRPSDSTLVTLNSSELRNFLFQTRFQRDYFDPVIVEHLRRVAHEQAVKEGLLDTNILSGQQIINIAPLSPVANETWVFWEIRRKLFYIASDIDLADPAFWKFQTLNIRSFDLNEQVVISQEEASGSNFYLTRYQISRALFNCVVLGQRIDVPPR
jgi:hypothetical protein